MCLTKTSQHNVPDAGIDLCYVCITKGIAAKRATPPGYRIVYLAGLGIKYLGEIGIPSRK